jgi:hypothetical protein
MNVQWLPRISFVREEEKPAAFVSEHNRHLINLLASRRKVQVGGETGRFEGVTNSYDAYRVLITIDLKIRRHNTCFNETRIVPLE